MQAHDERAQPDANEYVAPAVEAVMTEDALAREVKYAGDGTIVIEEPGG